MRKMSEPEIFDPLRILNNSYDTRLLAQIANPSFHFCTPRETIVMALQEGQKCFRGLVPPARLPLYARLSMKREEEGTRMRGREVERQPRARGLIRCKCMCVYVYDGKEESE